MKFMHKQIDIELHGIDKNEVSAELECKQTNVLSVMFAFKKDILSSRENAFISTWDAGRIKVIFEIISIE
jgi:hypothetical protein